jgi:Uncharacterised protein family UPF0547
MAILPPPPTPTRSAIYAAYEANRDDGFRDHLGASLIGKHCERALWFDFRWVTPVQFSGRILRLFESGQLEEARLVRNLRATGATVLDRDPETGRQWRVEAHGGHFGGSLDAVAIGLKEAPKTWHVVEFKTHSTKSFFDLTTKGVAQSKPQHWAQMQIYTGFNAPAVDLIAMLRPTKSAGLYVQMAGRGTRLAPGKNNCLVLDFAGNVARHGPVDAVTPRAPTDGDGAAPTKICPDCDSILAAAARQCPDCGHWFSPPEVKVAATASTLAILSSVRPQWVTVSAVSYARHEKPGKPPSLSAQAPAGLSHLGAVQGRQAPPAGGALPRSTVRRPRNSSRHRPPVRLAAGKPRQSRSGQPAGDR